MYYDKGHATANQPVIVLRKMANRFQALGSSVAGQGMRENKMPTARVIASGLSFAPFHVYSGATGAALAVLSLMGTT